MKSLIVLAVALTASISFANANQMDYEPEDAFADTDVETGMSLELIKPMYSFAEKCEAKNQVSLVGAPDSDNVVIYTTQQLKYAMGLGDGITDARSAELEKEMVEKRQLKCVSPNEIKAI